MPLYDPTTSDRGRHDVYFLASKEAQVGRAARVAETNFQYTVWAEMASRTDTEVRTHVELDADDRHHAIGLMELWVGQMGALSASYRRAWPDGRIDRQAIAIIDFRHFAYGDD